MFNFGIDMGGPAKLQIGPGRPLWDRHGGPALLKWGPLWDRLWGPLWDRHGGPCLAEMNIVALRRNPFFGLQVAQGFMGKLS